MKPLLNTEVTLENGGGVGVSISLPRCSAWLGTATISHCDVIYVQKEEEEGEDVINDIL